MSLYRDYVRAMYVMFKSAFLYETNNDALRTACERVSAIANRLRDQADGVASLELLPEGAYVNRVLIQLDTGLYDQTEYLLAIFSTLGVSTVSALGQTTIADWLEVITLFKRCVGPGGDLQELGKATFQRIRISADKGQGARNALGVTSKLLALRAYATTVIALNEVLDALRQGRRLRPLWIKRPLQEMVSVAGEAGPLLLALAQLKRHKLTLAHHLANSAVFAICAVRPLGLPRRLVAQLAMEAALHDLGRAFAVETEAVHGLLAERRYALETMRKLVTSGTVGDRMMARVVVANEVRRWASRRGEPAGDWPYPFGLGERTKIVAVAHGYSMLTTHLRERPSLLPDDAMRVLVAESGRRYDPVAVKLFVDALGIYPVGSTVALSDRRVAVVVESPRDAGSPRPRVKIVRDNEGSLVDGALIDLATQPEPRIVQCIDGEAYEVNAPAFLLS